MLSRITWPGGALVRWLMGSTHLNQQTSSSPIWTLKSDKMGLETDRSSGWSSSHNEWSRYCHFTPQVNLQQFASSTSHLAGSCFPKTLSICNTAKRSCLHFSCSVSLSQFLKWELFVTFTGATAGPSVFSYWGLFKDQHSIPVPFSTCMFRIWKSCLCCSRLSADQSDFTCVAVQAGMCATATEYNQDLEHDVLSLCTPLDVTFLLFSSSSVFASKMHTSVLPRPQCLLDLIFANLSRINYSNAQSGFTRRSELSEPIMHCLEMVRCWRRRLVPVLTAEVFSSYLYCILFYGNFSGLHCFFIEMVNKDSCKLICSSICAVFVVFVRKPENSFNSLLSFLPIYIHF